MSKSSVVIALKALAVVCGVAFAVACVAFVPHIGTLLSGTFGGVVSPTLCAIFLYVTVLPACAALFDAWRVFTDIGRDKSFSAVNAARLKRISWYAALDTALYGALCALAYFFGARAFDAAIVNYTAFITLVIFFFGAVLTVIVRALSALVTDAARIKDENDLTV